MSAKNANIKNDKKKRTKDKKVYEIGDLDISGCIHLRTSQSKEKTKKNLNTIFVCSSDKFFCLLIDCFKVREMSE